MANMINEISLENFNVIFRLFGFRILLRFSRYLLII